MRNVFLLLSMVICTLASAQATKKCSVPSKSAALHNEAQLKVDYENFIDALDALKIVDEYPGAVKLLLSSKAEKQIRGIQILRGSQEVEILPCLVPLVESSNRQVRIEALLAIKELVSYHTLQRRDLSRQEGIYIKPKETDDADFSPLAWLVLLQLRHSEEAPNMKAYAATMAGYLNLALFKGELEVLLQSRHPAVVQCAQEALRMIREGHG